MLFEEKDSLRLEAFPLLFVDDESEEDKLKKIPKEEDFPFQKMELPVIPTVPEEYYQTAAAIDDDLSRGIKEIERDGNTINRILQGIGMECNSTKLTLMVGKEASGYLLQIGSVGVYDAGMEPVLLKKDDPILVHLCTGGRVTHIANLEKIDSMFENINLGREFGEVQSLLIFPFRIAEGVLGLLFIAFSDRIMEELEGIIHIVMEKYEELLEEEVLRLIKEDNFLDK